MGSCDVTMVETSTMSQLELPKIASSSDVTFGHEKNGGCYDFKDIVWRSDEYLNSQSEKLRQDPQE